MQTKLWKCYGSCMDLIGGDSYYLFLKWIIILYLLLYHDVMLFMKLLMLFIIYYIFYYAFYLYNVWFYLFIKQWF